MPLLWVPKAESLAEGVVDVYGRRHLFAFSNSGCIACSKIVERAVSAVEKVGRLGFGKVMLDAVRLPSPVDGLLFLTTCFCSYSHELCPELGCLRDEVRDALCRASASDILQVLEGLAHARAVHVEYMLSALRDKARELGINLGMKGREALKKLA